MLVLRVFSEYVHRRPVTDHRGAHDLRTKGHSEEARGKHRPGLYVPALKLAYTAKGLAPAVKISGTVEQSGVDDDFSMQAPVEIQFAKGPAQVIWVETSNDGAAFSATLKQVPVKVSIPAGRGVLAVKR